MIRALAVGTCVGVAAFGVLLAVVLLLSPRPELAVVALIGAALAAAATAARLIEIDRR